MLQNGWTPLHCAARAGFLDVVKLLVESGASPKAETNFGSAPIWFAASEGHNEVLKYLMAKEHDTYSLMEDKRVRPLSTGFQLFLMCHFLLRILSFRQQFGYECRLGYGLQFQSLQAGSWGHSASF